MRPQLLRCGTSSCGRLLREARCLGEHPRPLATRSLSTEAPASVQGTSASQTRYSETRSFGTSEVEAFAALSGDVNPMHSDSPVAADGRFGKPIVHGMLYASMFGAMMGRRHPGAVYVSQSLEFKRPVFIDEAVTATMALEHTSASGRILDFGTTCVNQNGQVVLGGNARVLLPREGASDAPPPSPELRACKSPNTDGTKVLVWQCFDVYVERSSGNVGIMVDDATSTITQVIPKSAGDRAGLAPFDRVVAVNSTPLNGSRLANTALALKRRSPAMLRVERPPRSAWPRLADDISEAGDKIWLDAALSFAQGDIDSMVEAMRTLPGSQARRLSVDEVSALALLALARTGSSLQLRAGMLLFDVAAESGHGDLVQHLLLPMITRERAGGAATVDNKAVGGRRASLPRSESVETIVSEDGTCTESDYGMDDKSETYDQISYMDGEESEESEV